MDNIISALRDRFFRYVQIDTQSDESSGATPSTAKQFTLLRLLADELQELGVEDVTLTDYACVMGSVPATIDDPNIPVVAFLAHVDTVPDFSGANVKPILHASYDGSPIVLPHDPTQIIDSQNSPQLKGKIGEDIVTASGTTVLGADNKAGIAILMTLAEQLIADQSTPRGKIRICFTPDEEIGTGVQHLKLDELGADVAYTLDGGDVGEVAYETFSADKAVISIAGIAIHPGDAKDKMVNALQLVVQIGAQLPIEAHTPATTSGREGYIHLYEVAGNAAHVEMRLLIRDFELDGLAEKGELVQQICRQTAQQEPRAQISCEISPQYRNMRYWLEKDMRPVEYAYQATQKTGIKPFSKPARGGTDGSQLTERGLPTPNLYTGMQNVHSPLEWVSLQDMALSLQMCRHLAEIWAKS